MIGLDIIDAIILFFGYVFIAALPTFCVVKYMDDSATSAFLLILSIIWFGLVLAVLYSMHDFIFYLGVVGG